ncbi:MAG TPA: RNA polymerase factor sigma-54 [Candidatus Limnocylindrales bacterium]|nr:RNA polymerase factor sigma-54 [Candidatus Limnocylindrales bacterium]
MIMDTRLNLKMTQRLVMTPMLQQAIKLLQMSALELKEMIEQEVIENPLLEVSLEDEPDQEKIGIEEIERELDGESSIQIESPPPTWEEPLETEPEEKKSSDLVNWEDYFEDNPSGLGEFTEWDPDSEGPSYENILTKSSSLIDHLIWQLQLTTSSEEELRIGTLIIGNIEEDGYLRTPLEDIAQEALCRVEDVERVLRKIQNFDPAGVGARDYRECFLIQIQHLKLQNTVIEKIIQENLLEPLVRGKYQELASKFNTTVEDIKLAHKILKKLNPKPGLEYSDEKTRYIIPDLYVYKMGSEYEVVLNEEDIPRLRINSLYKSILRHNNAEVSESTRQYVEQKLRSAIWLIRSIEQRKRTIYKVGKSIIKFQSEFLDHGISHLKPLVLRDVAEDISMHESTVSRVTTNKYMHTPRGIFELKFFFHSGLSRTSGNDISSIAVKEKIKNIILNEDTANPYSDKEILDLLKKDGIEIARRTIAKYREDLNIPSSVKRKRKTS